MEFYLGLFILSMTFLGMNFCFVLVGGLPWHKGEEFEPVKIGKKSFTVEMFAVGTSIFVLGATGMAAWLHMGFFEGKEFLTVFYEYPLYMSLQFMTAVAMMSAGVGIFRQCKRYKGIFLTSIGILMFGMFVAFLSGGHRPPAPMMLVAICTLIVGTFFTTVLYTIGRFLSTYDEQLVEVPSGTSVSF